MRCICQPCAEHVKPQVPTKNNVPQRAIGTAGRDSIKLKKKISKHPKIKEASATQPVTATCSTTPLGHNYTACKNLSDHLYKIKLAQNIDSPKVQ